MNDHSEVAWTGELPHCDLCLAGWTWPGAPDNGEVGRKRPAVADAKTDLGPWAYVCQEHFDACGCSLGLGRGQRLVPTELTYDCRLDPISPHFDPTELEAMSGIPPEVDFAARYWAGDWTDQAMPEVLAHPRPTGMVWTWADPDGVTFSAVREPDNTYTVRWEEDHLATAHVRQEPDGTFSTLSWDGPGQWKIVTRTRLDITDGFWVLVEEDS